MRFFVGSREMRNCLVNRKGPWIVNLPVGFVIIDCRADAERGGVFFTVQSDSFPRIACGALIPELEPQFNGLMYCL
jgi:hypothetical protein